MRKKMNVRLIETLTPPKVRRYEIADELLPGLRLRVYPTGRKVWSAIARSDRRQVRQNIGTYPAIDLAEARDAARIILRDTQLGRVVR